MALTTPRQTPASYGTNAGNRFTGVWLTPEFRERVDERARERRLTHSDACREALALWLAHTRRDTTA